MKKSKHRYLMDGGEKPLPERSTKRKTSVASVTNTRKYSKFSKINEMQ